MPQYYSLFNQTKSVLSLSIIRCSYILSRQETPNSGERERKGGMRKGRKSERNEVWTGPWVTVATRTLFGAGSSCNCVGAKVAIPQTEARGSVFGTVAMLYGPCTLGCLWLTLQRLQGCGQCGNERRPVGSCNCVGTKVAIPQTDAWDSVSVMVGMLHGPCTSVRSSYRKPRLGRACSGRLRCCMVRVH